MQIHPYEPAESEARHAIPKASKRPNARPVVTETPPKKYSDRTAANRAIEWLIPAALLALCAVPIVGGAVRVAQLTAGATITPDNARFFASPFPVMLHIVSSIVYCALGAFQFVPGFRRRRPKWHRTAGRILVPSGLLVALSGLWMTLFYPSIEHDGSVLYGMRLLVGSAMVACICLGMDAIRQRDFARHRDWMIRGYALGIGAGTQVFTHLPWLLFPDRRGEMLRTLCMGAGWVINIAVAEWIIQKRSPHPHLQ